MVPCPGRSRLAPWRPEVATPGAISGASGNTPQGRGRSRCWAGPHWPTKAPLKWEENGGWMGMYHGEIMGISWKSVVYQLRMRILCAYSWIHEIFDWIYITNQLIPTWRRRRGFVGENFGIRCAQQIALKSWVKWLSHKILRYSIFKQTDWDHNQYLEISFAKMRGNYQDRKFPPNGLKTLGK